MEIRFPIFDFESFGLQLWTWKRFEIGSLRSGKLPLEKLCGAEKLTAKSCNVIVYYGGRSLRRTQPRANHKVTQLEEQLSVNHLILSSTSTCNWILEFPQWWMGQPTTWHALCLNTSGPMGIMVLSRLIAVLAIWQAEFPSVNKLIPMTFKRPGRTSKMFPSFCFTFVEIASATWWQFCQIGGTGWLWVVCQVAPDQTAVSQPPQHRPSHPSPPFHLANAE